MQVRLARSKSVLTSNSMRKVFYLVLLTIAFTACSDEDYQSSMSELEQDTCVWMPGADIHEVTILANAEQSWKVETDEQWLFAMGNVGCGNASIKISVQENQDEESRTAHIIVRSIDNNEIIKKIIVEQKGISALSNNALMTSDLIKNYGVGWGYDSFGEYAEPSYVRGQIIDYQRLLSIEDSLQENFCTDEPQYGLEYSKQTAHSVEEYTHTTTTTTRTKTKVLFFKKETEKRFTKTTTTNVDRSFATMSILNIVAQRYISESGIIALLANGYDDILTDNFKKDVKSLSSNPCKQEAETFLKKYGQNVITTAWLGGRLDYSLSIQTTKTTDIETTVTATYKKLFKKSSSMTTEERNVLESIKVDYDCNYNVKGGNAAFVRSKIGSNIEKKEPIDESILANWEADFKDANSMLNQSDDAKKPTMIDFRLMPIYELVNNNAARQILESTILGQAALPENCFATSSLVNFSVDESSRSNVSVVNVKDGESDNSVAEIDKEYIPSIRTDCPVTVVYPIMSDGTTDITNGYFIGDGEGHAPGRIIWNSDKNTCVYTADPSFNEYDKVSQLFAFKGYIYSQREDFFPSTEMKGTVIPLNVTMDGESLRITKIGMGFWAFSNSVESLISISTPLGNSYELSSVNIDAFNKLATFLANDSSPLFANGATGVNLEANDYVRNISDSYKIFFIGWSGIIKCISDKATKNDTGFLFYINSVR